MNLRVWAPHAQSVKVLLGAEPQPMVEDSGGWWRLARDLPGGTRYRFILDDSEPLADPRSPSQPDGVFGPSAAIDHSAFAWHDAGWQSPPLDSAIIYELHIGTFSAGGTFDSAIPYLDHLVALGVTHVEIMPVNEFAGTRGWGYDGVLVWAPHHGYGGPDGMKRFIDACHARGLAVLLDVVYNHFGPEGSVVHRYGPYTTDQYRTPWGAAINLDQAGSDEVRRFFCDNALMWLRDYHCDGLRIDAIHAFHDHTALPFQAVAGNTHLVKNFGSFRAGNDLSGRRGWHGHGEQGRFGGKAIQIHVANPLQKGHQGSDFVVRKVVLDHATLPGIQRLWIA